MIQYDLNSVSNFRLFGFATGSYSCKCAECGIEFIGDKRSVQCLECAIKHAQKTAHNSDYAKCHVCGEPWNMKKHGACQCGAYIKKRS